MPGGKLRQDWEKVPSTSRMVFNDSFFFSLFTLKNTKVNRNRAMNFMYL